MKKINELRISHKELDLINAEFEANKPYESCGVLIGTTHESIADVEKAIPITNIRRTIVSFELDPIQFYNAWRDAENNGKDIVGIYHTHPNYPAVPSLWDRETMENDSSVWLIAGIDGTMAYILDDNIRPVRLEIK